jgi:pre-mRNA-splicing factor SPF27
MPALDSARYRLDPPPQTKRNDFASWKSSLDNANSQLEHQHLRIMNLELLLKNGDKVWRAQTQMDENILKWAEEAVLETKKEVEHTNRERKLQQTAAGR